MLIYGQLVAAQAENLGADPTGLGLVEGRIWFRTDLDVYRGYANGTVVEFADLATAQTFQNKILNGANVSNYLEFDQLGSTPSNPAAGKNRIYFKTDGTAYTLDENGNEQPLGSGSGGSKNYFDPVDAEIDSTIGNWATDDGVGGSSAGLSLAVTAVAGELLAGTNSLKLTKDAADRNGHFIKVQSITIDPADRGIPLHGSFQFRPLTGYVSSDLIWEVYDVTNAAVLYSGVASDLELPNVQAKFNFTTYLEDTTAQVEFRAKINNTNTNSFDAVFDEFKFGPTSQVNGFYSHKARSYSPATNWTNNVGHAASYARYGNIMRIYFRTSVSGAQGDGTYTMGLPSGHTIDTSEIVGTVDVRRYAFDGMVNYWDNSRSLSFRAIPVYESAGAISLKMINDDNTTIHEELLLESSISQPFAVEANDVIHGWVDVPIAEWKVGDLVTPNELSQQTVKVDAAIQTGEALTADVTDISFGVINKNTHGAWDGTEFTAPASGTYDIEGLLRFTANATRAISAYVNGTITRALSTNAYNGILSKFSGSVILNKGDVLTFRSDVSESTATGIQSNNWVTIESKPDFTFLGVVRNQEYKEVILASNTVTVTANVAVDIVGASLFLDEGEWEFGWALPLFFDYVSGASVGVSAGVFLTDSSNNIEAASEANFYKVMSSEDDQIGPYSKNTVRVVVTSPDTYKLRMRCNQNNTVAQIFADITSSYGDGRVWARRIK